MSLPDYTHELRALQKSNRLRERNSTSSTTIDFASNDYLALAHHTLLAHKSYESIMQAKQHGAKASMLVNGYHPLHEACESRLARYSGYEKCALFGSGFNANIALIESLVRHNDKLFIDEAYHASGMLATKLVQGDVEIFRHNDAEHLHSLLKQSNAKRNIIATEGVYSMHGDLLNRDIIDLALQYDAYLILDEAHSSGVIGEHLQGILDVYGYDIAPNFIKMGTLGKAYGSFGAYICANEHINSYLENRAKPMIYATALSLFDTAYAYHSAHYIHTHATMLHHALSQNISLCNHALQMNQHSPIMAIEMPNITMLMQKKALLQSHGIAIGAIRPPTVHKPIIRFIARLGEKRSHLEKALRLITT